ncbi:MAG: hypothetical protein JAY62_17770 [Candidatus Thiodiazotropha endolucinida]|nr:hypothetical protein [Candidatus Thiodiazotropha taylori]MCW4276970.1 hypothetical protein [Candidatus Thiodiazotropha taylori]
MVDLHDKVETFDLDDVISPDAMVEERPDLFTVGRIDWYLRQRHRNGLAEAGAVLQVGRRMYLVKSRFVQWFITQSS